MPKLSKRLSAAEILTLLDKQYLNTEDIKKIACVSIDKAREIRNEITRNLKEKNYFVPDKLIPSESLVDYLNLNLNYLKKIAKNN